MNSEIARYLTPELAREIQSAPFDEVASKFWKPLTHDGGDAASAWLGLHDRFYLLSVLMGRADVVNPWLYQRCREVEANPDGYLDLWAREHYKSTIITFAGCIQEALRDPEITIGIFSHTAPHAKKFLVQIMMELEVNDRLKALYPDVLWADPEKEAPAWSLERGLTLKRKSNPKEQTFEAHGLVKGMPTGSHFRLRVYDDVVTKDAVGTPDQVKKTTEAWSLSQALGATQVLPDGRELPGREWMIGTRYSFADTYQDIINMKAVRLRVYPATDTGLRDGRPVFLAPEVWADKLRKMIPSVLAAQMLQNPAAGNEAMFRKEWLRFRSVRAKTLNVYILCDPANSKKKESDRTAMACIGEDTGRNKTLLDGYDHKMSLAERWTNLKNLHRRWSNEPGVQMVKVGYERYGMQADLEYFEERMEIEKYHFVIEEVNWPLVGPGSKEDRIERLVPDFMQEKFWLIAAPPRYKQLTDGGRMSRPEDPDELAAYLMVPGTEYDAETPAQRQCREAGESYRILTLVKRRDHEGNLYSLNKNFLEQYLVFPFAPKKDLLDACSRIYDLDPQPPVIIDAADLEPEVFADGI